MVAGLKRASVLVALCCVAITACTPAVPPGESCSTPAFRVDDDFEGARRGPCRASGDERVRLEILPEDANVANESPWFAFRLTPSRPGTATVVLDYGDWEHRYEPKISTDGRTWDRLDAKAVTVTRGGRRAELRVPLEAEPVWVAAQELIMPSQYDEWAAKLASGSVAEVSELGRSRGGRPISIIRSPSTERDVVMLVGRQHPPEVSGAIAFFPFVERLFADDQLATDFRARYEILAIPILNPDGVVEGHWRHALGEMDLNRDWGEFSQPETRLVADVLESLNAEGRRLSLFLDFHSTKRNVFYTFPDDETNPPDFFPDWFERAEPRLENYPFSNANGRPKTEGVGKNYIMERYGIPAATYEAGDETDRDAAEAAAVIFAEELMQILMEQPDS